MLIHLNEIINHNHVTETDLSGLKVIDFVSSSGKHFSALSTLCCQAIAFCVSRFNLPKFYFWDKITEKLTIFYFKENNFKE